MQDLAPRHIVNNINYLDDTTNDDSFGDGFHLPKSVSALADMYKCETESLVSSVTSKRRIDMLFGDSRSVVSEYHINRKYHEPRQVKSLIEGVEDDAYYEEDTTAKNDVQERIEMMFSEISSSEQEANTNKSTTNNKFAVQHLGSMAVQGKINSVHGLQEPLKELFFKYCTHKKKNTAGAIQITDNGLNIEYNGNYGGKIEKLYPFSNIATWASLKFALQSNERGNEYAFLPVVANSDNLFRPLDEELAENFVGTHNTPLFVVVMREPDSPTKQLSCHGFVCQSSEDAVVIATSLYKTLIGKLSKNRAKNKLAKRRSRQAANHLSSIGEISPMETVELDNYAQVEKPPPPPPPTRPPRKIKDTTKRRQADESEKSVRAVETGDVLTKVAIPRSSSFLNTNRLSSRYQDAKPVEVQRTTGSPLGFVEMFNELQTHEGLQTIDEILNVIIKAEGMSFNDLKPIYKEFLLKLALVLSKDELYHRSKSIMNSQKNKDKTSRLRKVITIKSGLKNAFRKPLVKLKKDSCSCVKTNTKTYDGTSTDSFFLADGPNAEDAKRQTKTPASGRHKTFRFRSQLITSTSEDSDYPKVDQRKFKTKIKEDPLRPSSSGYFSFSECSYDTESCTCTSADKCYCSLSKQKPDRKSKINYAPCHCDTMTCNKRNKCYCTKTNNRLSLVEQLKRKGFAVSESSLSPDDTNKKISARDKSNTKLSKSLEYLENGSKKYKSRMELYENGQKAYPCRNTYQYSPSFSSESSKTSQKRSVSSDNLAVDYSMFAKSDDRLVKDTNHIYRSSKKMSRKQNVVYAELACPQIGHSTGFKRTYSIPQILPSVRMDSPPMLAVYPHAAVRTCTCACSCPIFTGEPFSACKTVHPASTPFYRMNMENIFGYYP